MPAFDFPSSPTIGQVYQYYTWDGEKWYSTLGGIAGPTPETVAFLARTSGLDATHTNAYTALIDGLVADGVWTKLDMLHIYATQNSTTALLNLVSTSYNGTVNGSPTFTADRGYTGATGSTVYINTSFNQTTAVSPKYTLNSGHISTWNLTEMTQFNSVMGNTNSGDTTSTLIIPKATDNNFYYRINTSATSGNADRVGIQSAVGHFISNRTSSSATGAFRNGTPVASNTYSPSGLTNNNMYTLGFNNNGAATGSTWQTAVASIGAGLTNTEVSRFYYRLFLYMVAVGAVVSPTAAFLARTSGLDTTHTNAYTALINGLMADGVWETFDVLHIYATNSSANALLNLKSSSFDGVINGSPTFTADRGFTGVEASTSVYIQTNFNMTGNPKYQQNSAHMSGWIVNNVQGNPCVGWLYGISTNNSYVWPRDNTDKAYIRLNSNPSGDVSITNTDSRGHWINCRTGASALQLYRNGASFHTGTAASVGLNAVSMITLGYQVGGGGNPTGYGGQVAAISIGGGLDATQATNFYSRLRTYMTAVGVP